MDERLNQEALKGWSQEHLVEYFNYLQHQIGKCTVFAAQVQVEFDRRDNE